SNFDFLRYSAAESFSLRASMASLAMRDLFYPCCTILSRSAPLSPRVGVRPGKGDSSSPAPAQRRRRTVSVAPRGKRHRPRGARMRLLPRLLAQRVQLRAAQLAVVARPPPFHADAAVVRAARLEHRGAPGLLLPLLHVRPPLGDEPP